MSKREKSSQLFQEALRLLPGGVNSPARAFHAVGGDPFFIERGKGPYLFDVDGNRYIDYVLSWGPIILGHAHPKVVEALSRAVPRGTSFGAPSSLEVELASLVQSFMPAIQMIRFVNSGTEATMSALRLARAFTKRDKLIKFEGNYHGHSDMLLVKGGSGIATLGLPDSPGVTPGAAQDTLIARYNNLDSVETLLERNEGEVAAVIVEPVAGNMGLVPPSHIFLKGLRRLTREHGALLIFDEVMTGFRVHPGGAQSLYRIEPDLTALGKVIGGGLPVGAYGGRKDLMELVAPMGPVYQAGTLSGNPLAMTAGIVTLKELQQPGVWEELEANGARLAEGLRNAADAASVSLTVNRVGSMFGVFFSDQMPADWSSASLTNKEHYSRFFWEMLAAGVYLPPSPFEACFISTAHQRSIIDVTIKAAGKAFASL